MRKGRLLAKSYKGGGEVPPYALLTNHTRDVVDAGNALVSSVGALALLNANLPDSDWWERLARSSRLGFWLHDIGKANEHFHLIVEGNRDFAQILRHETISALLAIREPIRGWLVESGYNEQLLYPALWAVAGHHRKFHKHTKPENASPSELYLDHSDFRSILKEMATKLMFDSKEKLREVLDSLAIPMKVMARDGDSCDIVAATNLPDLKEDWKKWAEKHGNEIGFNRLVAIQKTITIAADVCASAFVRRDNADREMPIGEFVTSSLAAGLTPTDLDELAWRYAWQTVDEESDIPENPTGFPPGFVLREFQQEVAEHDSTGPPSSLLTFAVAGCGSGKSLAAYLWARRWCQVWADEGRTNFRLIFTLPTTGTATEHFKDYALACGVSPKLKGLSHSRSSVDLNFVAEETAAQEEGSTQAGKIEQAEQMLQAQADKIESLDLWGTPLVVGTADTVLGLMANARRSVYSFPAIMQSAIVFDEIHAYDEELFGHLLIFLETFPKIPVLLMTASLPKERREAIEKVRNDLRVVRGPEEHELRRRYAPPILAEDASGVWDAIRECLNDPARGKVLWVRNQVDRAVRSYRECHERLAMDEAFIGLYHSRFRYKDRAKVHAEVIKRFKKKGMPCVLVATQVAEMSLDLSADLLISDLATIPALIQRLGRLNRFAETDEGPSGMVIFCRPPIPYGKKAPDPLPYSSDELKHAESWIEKLRGLGRRLSQRDLSEAFSPDLDTGQAIDLKTARECAVFISGLWQTYPASTRGDGYTMSVVLSEDVDKYPDEKRGDYKFRRDWLRKYEVSIPIKPEMRGWKPFGRTPIAPGNAVRYGHIDSKIPSERTGASWTDHRSFIY